MAVYRFRILLRIPGKKSLVSVDIIFDRKRASTLFCLVAIRECLELRQAKWSHFHVCWISDNPLRACCVCMSIGRDFESRRAREFRMRCSKLEAFFFLFTLLMTCILKGFVSVSLSFFVFRMGQHGKKEMLFQRALPWLFGAKSIVSSEQIFPITNPF